jgi:hypothetical protein
LPELDVYSQIILLRIYRLSRGIEDNETCHVGFVKLAKKCQMSRKQAIKCVNKLETLGLIERVDYIQKGVAKSDRGNVYRINLPAVTRPQRTRVQDTRVLDTDNQRTPYKDKSSKETNKEDLASHPPDCPDCHGSGFYYPNGVEKGVAKCKHSSLRPL